MKLMKQFKACTTIGSCGFLVYQLDLLFFFLQKNFFFQKRVRILSFFSLVEDSSWKKFGFIRGGKSLSLLRRRKIYLESNKIHMVTVFIISWNKKCKICMIRDFCFFNKCTYYKIGSMSIVSLGFRSLNILLETQLFFLGWFNLLTRNSSGLAI